jgi:IS1 family transposase
MIIQVLHTGKVLAYVFGRRQDTVFVELKALLEPFGITQYYPDGWVPTSGMWRQKTIQFASRCPRSLIASMLATSYNCHKNERNGNAYQRNHEYWPSPRLCRL